MINPNLAKKVESAQALSFSSQEQESCLQRASELEARFQQIEASQAKNKDPVVTDIIEELNKKHAVIHTATTHILFEKGNCDFVLDSKSSFLNLYENDVVQLEKKTLSKAQIWLKSPNRRTFHNIVLNPDVAGHYGDNYNIWKGFAINPVKGDCSLFWDLVKNIICSGKDVHYNYVRKWLAHLIQKPKIIATALILRGKQGTGKGTFVDAIGKLLGPHYAPLASLDHITGRFNSHLKNAILIFADEAIWSGNKREIGILKSLITEPQLFIEAKGKDGYWIDNFKHLIVSSNEDWVVHLDADDRRFFVLDVSSDKKEDHSYFNAIYTQLKQGGYEAILYDLRNEDLSGFDPKIMPENFSGFDMKMESSTSVERFIYVSLKEGCWDHASSDPSSQLKDLPIDDFYKTYKSWCQQESQEALPKETMGKKLKKLIPGLSIKRGSREVYSNRPNCYIFPSLSECRRTFENYYKQDSRIWEWS